MGRLRILLLTGIVSVFFFSSKPLNIKAASMLQGSKVKKYITVSAAISLKDPLTEIERDFEKENKNVLLQFNYGGSGTLEKQIENGAPVDIFISADTNNIDRLNNRGLIARKSIRYIAYNMLVLVSGKEFANRISNINDLTRRDVEQISIGFPGSVPAGDYSKEVLEHLKLWDKLRGKIVYAKDVKQVLTYVKTGNAAAGFVYVTDVKKDKDVFIKQIIPDNLHKKIVYQGAIINSTENMDICIKFMDYLTKKRAQIVLQKYGFTKAVK